jgi:GNAT superfamily N-acetyltransferase
MADLTRDVTVRRLRTDDAPRWRELWDGYVSFYRAELPGEVTDYTFERLCDGEQGLVGLVAVDADDRPVGIAHLVFHPVTWSRVVSCYLEDLYVDRVRRGGQVARVLFDAIYTFAREHGADRVYWHTQQFNGAARSLYDTVGALTSFVVYKHDLD